MPVLFKPRRDLLMPVRRLLKTVRDIQQTRFFKIIANHLQTHRQSVGKPGRKGIPARFADTV